MCYSVFSRSEIGIPFTYVEGETNGSSGETIRSRFISREIFTENYPIYALGKLKCQQIRPTEHCENMLYLLHVRFAMIAGGKRDHQASDASHQHADANKRRSCPRGIGRPLSPDQQAQD
jgi:hypothetical protein